jgi:sulfur carrier protein ThiS
MEWNMVKVMFRDKQWELRAGMTVRDAILKVGLDPQAVLAVRDGKLINEATILGDGETVKLIAVISGG